MWLDLYKLAGTERAQQEYYTGREVEMLGRMNHPNKEGHPLSELVRYVIEEWMLATLVRPEEIRELASGKSWMNWLRNGELVSRTFLTPAESPYGSAYAEHTIFVEDKTELHRHWNILPNGVESYSNESTAVGFENQNIIVRFQQDGSVLYTESLTNYYKLLPPSEHSCSSRIFPHQLPGSPTIIQETTKNYVNAIQTSVSALEGKTENMTVVNISSGGRNPTLRQSIKALNDDAQIYSFHLLPGESAQTTLGIPQRVVRKGGLIRSVEFQNSNNTTSHTFEYGTGKDSNL